MKWYIIRHGETDFNKRGIVQGSGIDASLNAKGRLQADRFFELNKHISFDKVYTSKLRRTHESVAKFMDVLPHEEHAGLNEISWGIKEGEEVSNIADSYYMRVTQSWREGNLNNAIEGGESPLDVAKRQQFAVNHILSNNESCVLICMHGRAMRILLSQLLNTPFEDMDQFEHTNLCLYILEWDGNNFSLIERNRSIQL